jgi:type VI secretion system protein VasD
MNTVNGFVNKLLMSFLLCLGLVGCGAIQAVSDSVVGFGNDVLFTKIKKLKLDLIARNALNSSDRGQPLSVVVRIYQLKDGKSFQAASYQQLLSDDKVALASDLLATKEVVLLPGATLSLNEAMHEEATQIGILTLFRHINQESVWRTHLDVENLDNDKVAQLEFIENKMAWLFIPNPIKSKIAPIPVVDQLIKTVPVPK